MAVLFFVAGYFSVAAYDRKGLLPFVRDRFFRLGLPTLLYMFVIGPLTQYYLSRTWGTGGLAHPSLVRLTHRGWRSATRPVWSCATPLLCSIIYASVRFCGCEE